MRQVPARIGSNLAGLRFVIYVIDLCELTKCVEIHIWDPTRRAALDTWLDGVPTPPYHANGAHTWGLIAAHAHKRGHPSDSNDSWIAASCLAYGLPLATLNIKHYHAFATHERLELVTDQQPR